MPRGLYLIQAGSGSSSELLKHGDIVSFCLSPDNKFYELAKDRQYLASGSCPGGLKPLLKHLSGLPGDKIEVTPNGIVVNGKYLKGTARPELDSQDRAVPPSLLSSGIIPDGMALVLSPGHLGSFDSRHFGLMPISSLQKVEPVFTE